MEEMYFLSSSLQQQNKWWYLPSLTNKCIRGLDYESKGLAIQIEGSIPSTGPQKKV